MVYINVKKNNRCLKLFSTHIWPGRSLWRRRSRSVHWVWRHGDTHKVSRINTSYLQSCHLLRWKGCWRGNRSCNLVARKRPSGRGRITTPCYVGNSSASSRIDMVSLILCSVVGIGSSFWNEIADNMYRKCYLMLLQTAFLRKCHKM